MGYNSLSSLTSSLNNTAIGLDSLKTLSTNGLTQNGNNTAIGYASLAQCSTGVQNTAIGAFSGSQITIGQNNISIGYNSMYNATQVSDNICIGANSCNSLTIGSNNISIGVYSNLNTSTGANNISIGRYTQALSATGCNNIVISTNGVSGTPISAKGDNTAFIDARNGLYSYSPAYCMLVSTAFNNGTVTWSFWNDGVTTYNNGFTLYVSNTLVVQPFAGLYEITFSGSAVAQSSLYCQILLVVNTIKNYIVSYTSGAGVSGYLQNVAGSTLSRPYVSSNPIYTGWSVQVGDGNFYNSTYPLYMMIKFISL